MNTITHNYTATADEIKQRLGIVDIISEYVTLTRRGQNHWGMCPFHDEKTPSFSVNSEKGYYYCFGCREGGDIFNFIMKYHYINFKAARDLLAVRAGIDTRIDRGTYRRIQTAQKRRERIQYYKAKIKNSIHEEIKRLINIEQWTYLIINSICCETCLDRPTVKWALKTRDKVGFYLDELQGININKNPEYALVLIKESRGAVHDFR